MEDMAVKMVQHFNRANRLIKELIDKKQPLVDSVQLVIANEDKIKRDVFVHCTDSRLAGKGPLVWKQCHANINALRRIAPIVNQISAIAMKFFDEMVTTVVLLCRDTSGPNC